MAPRTLTTAQLNRALLARQGLLRRKRISVARMVEQTGGLQTQEPKDAFVSLWSRVDGFRAEQLRVAAERREIVRGSNLRCTIHTVTAGDFLAFRSTLAEVIEKDTANWRHAYAGMDKDAVIAAAKRLLADDMPRSGREIGVELAEEFPSADREGLTHCARIHVPVVMTPTGDRWGYSRPPKLALAERYLGAPLAPATPAAKTALLRRGIAAIGPASIADLRTWSGLTGVKEALEPLLPQLAEFRDEAGRTLYDLPGAPRPKATTEAPVRFLGEFDNVALSHADRARIIDAEDAKRFNLSKNGRRAHAVLIDGMINATWRIEAKRGEARLIVTPFRKLPKPTLDELSAEAEQLAKLVEPGADSYVIDVAAPGVTAAS